MKTGICIVLQKLVALVWNCWVFTRCSIGFVPIFRRNWLVLFSESSVQIHFIIPCKRTGITIHDSMYDRRYLELTTFSAESATLRGHVNLGLYTAG